MAMIDLTSAGLQFRARLDGDAVEIHRSEYAIFAPVPAVRSL
jgi:hypothetical protein